MSINIEALSSLLIPTLMLAVFVPAVLTLNKLKEQPKDPILDRPIKRPWANGAIQVGWAIVFCVYALGSFYFQSLLLHTGTRLPAGIRDAPIEIKGMTLYVTPKQAQWYAMSDWIHLAFVGTVVVAVLLARRNNDA